MRSGHGLGIRAGIVYIISAFFFVAVMSALGKAAGHLSAGCLAFFQNFLALLLFLPFFLRGGVEALRTDRFRLHLIRALGGLLSQVLMFVAVRQMALVDAVLLTNSTPLIMPLLAWVWTREKIAPRVWISLLIGFTGVVLILKPSSHFLAHPISLLALLSAVVSGVGLIAVNTLSKTEPSSRILFYYFAISSVLTFPFVVYSWSSPSQTDLLYLLGIGVTMALAQLLIILAYQKASAVLLAPFNFSVVIFSGLLGWLVWGHRPDAVAVIGVILVILSGVAIAGAGNIHLVGHFGWLGHLNVRFWRRTPSESVKDPLPHD